MLSSQRQCLGCSQNHEYEKDEIPKKIIFRDDRIIESQKVLGWKGPLEVI